MYLDGQLPGGPASDNTGGQVTQYAISALFGSPKLGPGNPKAGGNPLDQIGDKFYVTPDGGPVVVSPSVARAPGIVQYPITQPSTLYPSQEPLEPLANACNGLSGYDPATLITPGAVPNLPANMPVAPPQWPDTPNSNVMKPCPGYANDGSLLSLRNDAFRSGLSGCCRSGYQSADSMVIPDKKTDWMPFILAAAGLLVLTSRGKR